MSSETPLMSNVGELIAFLQQENPGVNELCQFGVMRTFNFIEGSSMFAARLDPDGSIRPLGQFGFSPEVMKSWERTSITDSFPTTDALKSNNIVWVADKDDWIREYPALANYGLDMTANTFVAWPITIAGSYMSVLGLCLRKVVAPTPELVSFFETVGGIFALQLSKDSTNPVNREEESIVALVNLFTRRQREVLQFMADGLTNSQIASELGFSESTIRQETMRIYEILGATGRADAVRMFRSIGQPKVS